MAFGRNIARKAGRAAQQGFRDPTPRSGVSRSEAVADLLGQSLALVRPMPKDRRAKAAELAAKEIDKLSNPSAPDEERQKRKRRLLEGPRELRNMRR
jgi:hypothetical protein